MSSMRHPAALAPEVKRLVEECIECEADRRPRMFLCSYHEGYWDGYEDALDADHIAEHVHAIIDWWRGANEAPGGCSDRDAINGMREHVMALRDLTGYR